MVPAHIQWRRVTAQRGDAEGVDMANLFRVKTFRGRGAAIMV